VREALDVAPVEELDPNLRIEPLKLAKLPVLPCDEGLLHHGHLDEEILLRKVEVGRERAHNSTLVVAVEDERVRLVIPGDSVVIEDLRALELAAIGEPGRSRATICLENGTFYPHLCHGSNRLGRPRLS